MLVHGRSRVVQATLKAAAKACLAGSGGRMARIYRGACGSELREEGITTRTVADAAVAGDGGH